MSARDTYDGETDPPCQAVTRRKFVKGLGASIVVTTIGGYAVTVWARDGSVPSALRPLAATPPTTFGSIAQGRTLVVVEMAGGNDGLNTVVPHANSTYYDLRPELAIENPIDLDGEVGFHPELNFLSGEYEAGRLAIVEGVGYPEPNLSHFESIDTWWTADVGTSDAAGWLGRMLDGTVGYDDPLAGITIGPNPSRALLGNSSFSMSIKDATGLQPRVPPWIDNVDELMGAWGGFAPAEDGSGGLTGAVRQSLSTTADSRGALASALGGQADRARRGAFEDQMSVAASLITSGLAPKVIYVHGFGDYDTHNNQLGRHTTELTEIDLGLKTFFSELADAGMSDGAIVLTMSEFGRRPRDNGSGTDHGTASPMFAVGSPVIGGRFGQTPSLTALDETSNMKHTVDFRSVYATVLDSWLEVDADGILGAGYERIPFL